jgi:hypothetical protein
MDALVWFGCVLLVIAIYLIVVRWIQQSEQGD